MQKTGPDAGAPRGAISYPTRRRWRLAPTPRWAVLAALPLLLGCPGGGGGAAGPAPQLSLHEVAVSAPLEAAGAYRVVVTGRVDAPAAPLKRLEVDGVPVPIDAGGRFAHEVTLPRGAHTVRVEAVDRAGARTSRSHTVLAGQAGHAAEAFGEGATLTLSAADLTRLADRVRGRLVERLQRGAETPAVALGLRPGADGVHADVVLAGPPARRGELRLVASTPALGRLRVAWSAVGGAASAQATSSTLPLGADVEAAAGDELAAALETALSHGARTERIALTDRVSILLALRPRRVRHEDDRVVIELTTRAYVPPAVPPELGAPAVVGPFGPALVLTRQVGLLRVDGGALNQLLQAAWDAGLLARRQADGARSIALDLPLIPADLARLAPTLAGSVSALELPVLHVRLSLAPAVAAAPGGAAALWLRDLEVTLTGLGFGGQTRILRARAQVALPLASLLPSTGGGGATTSATLVVDLLDAPAGGVPPAEVRALLEERLLTLLAAEARDGLRQVLGAALRAAPAPAAIGGGR